MEEEQITLSGLIESMRSMRKVSWVELEQSGRRKAVIEKLASFA